MRARYFKIILWIGALVGVWELGRSDMATNALFLLAAVGQVPGTGKTLTPQQIFVLLGVFLVVSLLLIFGSNIARGIHALLYGPINLADEQQAQASLPVASTNSRSKAVVIKIPAQPGRLRLAAGRAFALLRLAGLLAISGMQRHFPRLTRQLAAGVRRTADLALQAWLYSLPYIRAAAQFAKRQAIGAYGATLTTSMRFWRWLLPRSRQFDQWLGVQFRRGMGAATHNETAVMLMALWRECGRLANGWMTQIRAALDRTGEE